MFAANPASIKRHWHALAPAVVLMIVSSVGVSAATLWPSGERDQYAVVAPPSYNMGRTVQLVHAAGGDIVEVGGLTNVLIVHSADRNFVAALYQAGAWLVIDPLQLRGCLGFSQDSTWPRGRT